VARFMDGQAQKNGGHPEQYIPQRPKIHRVPKIRQVLQ